MILRLRDPNEDELFVFGADNAYDVGSVLCSTKIKCVDEQTDNNWSLPIFEGLAETRNGDAILCVSELNYERLKMIIAYVDSLGKWSAEG